MAGALRRLTVCRWLHAWSGIAFAISLGGDDVPLVSEMKLDAEDQRSST